MPSEFQFVRIRFSLEGLHNQSSGALGDTSLLDVQLGKFFSLIAPISIDRYLVSSSVPEKKAKN